MPSLPGLAGLDTPFLPQAIAWGYLLSSLPGLADLDTPFLPQAKAWGYFLPSLPGLADLDTPVSPQAEAWGNNLSSLPGRGFLDSTFFPIFNIDGSLSGHVNQVSKRRPTIAPQFTVGFMWQIQIGTVPAGTAQTHLA